MPVGVRCVDDGFDFAGGGHCGAPVVLISIMIRDAHSSTKAEETLGHARTARFDNCALGQFHSQRWVVCSFHLGNIVPY